MDQGSYSITIFLLVIGLVIFGRMRSMNRPIKNKGRRLLFPLFLLLPGFSLYAAPIQLADWQIGVAAGIGLLLSIPLIILTGYEVREDGQIYAKKSIAFIATFLIIVLLRAYFRRHLQGLDPKSIGILFYTLAVCYIVPWRIGCYMKFRKVYAGKEKIEMSIS
ncbi:cytochrome c biogenesis protein CcdC [Bacillus cereus group sp. Sample62]|uniref:cytochrome c biogenesis protein CcdC n=1 Tax=Bacillus TaxID=1386 RepID=UPI000868FE7C|nr:MULTISPECIES: cytochrome c biogenesis protein CcdC [Bacillus]MDJ1474157.1 cytochrome c biogenesis protein CcdC [Bacillus sp. LS15-K4]SCN34416.1 CcdC protein [Bacillus cereus]HDR4723756.1 cytochrome c biogenesis protein CcdC [Bacillus cereus]HDX9549276.1 cytochrome c biogenesis protein CcdC [Bacillus thuringiensis]